ncbi:Serine hydrolase FSH [Penicillium coprophilum]|uniref:Serine hydrolase FSH n=1 Tax=Penicillium coprophilum TaxID=36646 RepID=UPI002383A4E4|nr:Serine hydrolase FSH [Penicillium coprophilum]KAJ5177734.1 Serine hydrolase FSH [Penicillium coprophilum]
MPRILCLHGHGTSASIFKSQTAAFRSKLDESYVFDFIDAPFHSQSAPGIKTIYKTQTYTWWPQGTPESIRFAHKWVADYARENGPYDAFCCFSQGCSLTATMALYHAMNINEPDLEPLPFRAAIFICGGVPFPALEDMGLEVSPLAHEVNRYTGALLNDTAGQLTVLAQNLCLIKRGLGLWEYAAERNLHNPESRPERNNVFGLDFTKFPENARIKIPTVNIYGSKDPRWPAGIQLAEFCDDTMEFDHGGGHDIPRSTQVSNKIADMVRQVIERVNLPSTKVTEDEMVLEELSGLKVEYATISVDEL